MLILTRKLGEAITIGDDIKVVVLGIYGRQVRLGIEAPLKVVVHREEVYVKIQNQNHGVTEEKIDNGKKKSIPVRIIRTLREKLTSSETPLGPRGAEDDENDVIK